VSHCVGTADLLAPDWQGRLAGFRAGSEFSEIPLAGGEMAKMEVSPALAQPRLEMPGGGSLPPSVDQVVSAVQPVFLPLVALGQPGLR
jgi:hypothetical protein